MNNRAKSAFNYEKKNERKEPNGFKETKAKGTTEKKNEKQNEKTF